MATEASTAARPPLGPINVIAFEMNKEEARQILAVELRKFRETPYSELISKLGNQGCWEVLGASGAAYQVEVDIFWDNPKQKSGNLRVIGSIDDGGLSAFKPLSEDFVMTPDGQFIGEER